MREDDAMKKVELKDVKSYQAPKHFDMTALRAAWP